MGDTRIVGYGPDQPERGGRAALNPPQTPPRSAADPRLEASHVGQPQGGRVDLGARKEGNPAAEQGRVLLEPDLIDKPGVPQ